MEGLGKQGIQLLGDNDSDCVDSNRSGEQRPGCGVNLKSKMLRKGGVESLRILW